jgi:FlaA1/EpsC-like NDP-sugar epimerase
VVLAGAAPFGGADKFVLVSTDKAVHPVSVMGSTKRAAELLVSSMVGEGTDFVSVRFGNVLGSDGSVVPLFQRQIANGVPLTVTDPDATRYFMLVSEAVELVLEAGRMGRMGDLFVLDMGEPIRIGDLADNLVRMTGLEPGLDVPIRVTGLRPGERLHEHLPGADAEEVQTNAHDSILSVRGRRVDPAWFLTELEALRDLVARAAEEAALGHLRQMVCARCVARTTDAELQVNG